MKRKSKKWKENYEQLRTLSNDQVQETKDVNDVQFHIEIIIFKATATTTITMMNNRIEEKERKLRTVENTFKQFQETKDVFHIEMNYYYYIFKTTTIIIIIIESKMKRESKKWKENYEVENTFKFKKRKNIEMNYYF